MPLLTKTLQILYFVKLTVTIYITNIQDYKYRSGCHYPINFWL